MKPHIFSGWDYCISCGISKADMVQYQAMDSCPGDANGQYADARDKMRVGVPRKNRYKITMAPQGSQKFYERLGDLGVKKEPEPERKNYCRTGDGMARCMCVADKIDSKQCRFFRLSSYEPRCMYLAFTEYCDNHLAQKAEYLSMDDKP